MTDAKNVCPTCQYENEAEAAYCIRCGTVLLAIQGNFTTLMVSKEAAEAFLLGPTPPDELPENALAFYVMGQPEPMLLDNPSICVLGRYVPEEKLPVVDFSENGAYRLGVSRRHAMIRFSEEGCTVEDLGSSNGTWLNETRLQPLLPYILHSGDQLRLGLLALQVYFGSAASGQELEDCACGG